MYNYDKSIQTEIKEMKRVFLTFAFMVMASLLFANHWTPVGGTQYNMTMSGIILIDGVEQTGTNLEVGAFCGDECRGSMRAEFFPPSSQYVVALTVVSNVQSGEAITFRLFDHSTNQELDLVSVNDITFNNNDIIGTLGDWYEFSFETTTPVPSGNHWTPIGGTQYNMTMSGIILIDGVEQTGTNLEVGAFCGDECRGSMRAEFFPPSSQYVVALTVVSNVQSGEAITFRLFDHSTHQELDLVSVNDITFNNNDIMGTLGDWYEFSFLTPSSTVTYTLPITGYGTTAGGYYLIAPPFDNIDPEEIVGMTSGEYDLYSFDQTEDLEWRNYKTQHFNLESGKGYLYAHKSDVTLSFTGMPYSGDGKVMLKKQGGLEFEGWNLVGNPFPQAATIDRDCYVMKPDGTEIIASDVRVVAPMNGVFVIAASDGEEMTFVPQTNPDEGAKIVLNIQKDRGITVDRAIVRLEGNGALPKMMLDPNNTKIYIPQQGIDYAVVTATSDHTVPVCFKAQTNGTYSLHADVINFEVDDLHLIDHLTGADVNLLATPSYTFEASTTDYTERFQLVYSKTTGVEDAEVPFAYLNGTDLVIVESVNEGAVLQMFDANGRLVFSCSAAQRISIKDLPAGVYVLRLINGNETKAFKTVIR